MDVYKHEWFLPGERGFNCGPSIKWMMNNWTLAPICSVIYVIATLAGQRFMKHRKAFDLKNTLILWNVVVAIFSILGTIRFAPSFIYGLTTHGLVYSACTADFYHGVSGLWMLLFILSKLPELVDTVFLVLRKKPVTFLHLYHHATVLISAWHAYKYGMAASGWVAMMNLTVHAFMYTYYALRAAGAWFPKFVPMSITLMQLAQMIMGCIVSGIVWYEKMRGVPCNQPMDNLILMTTIYISYLALFVNFFVQSYFVKRKYDVKKPKKDENVLKDVQKNGHPTAKLADIRNRARRTGPD